MLKVGDIIKSKIHGFFSLMAQREEKKSLISRIRNILKV